MPHVAVDQWFESISPQRSVMQIIGCSAAEPQWKSTIGARHCKASPQQIYRKECAATIKCNTVEAVVQVEEIDGAIAEERHGECPTI